MSIYDTNSMLSTVFRPVKYTFQTSTKGETPIADLSNGAAEFVENKAGITVALEDFADKFNGDLHGELKSNITQKETKSNLFTWLNDKFGTSRKNIFESKKAQEYLKENENIFQSDIYFEENCKNGGVLYAKSDDDVYKAALNFASAEINAIEDANFCVSEIDGDNKLDVGDVSSYSDKDKIEIGLMMDEIDIDGKPGLSKEEYASYILAIDTAAQYYVPNALAGLGAIAPDGLISQNDSAALENMRFDEVKERAEKYFQEF